eukprot:gb/GECH01014559.1/.p1 GENE.gb/GECH01014559.1/~~gb/GECH01014559.1/.p1  ORF type:complete len:1374 (+),score=211.45 gb/GECH01014559.1/:1-4122(+)
MNQPPLETLTKLQNYLQEEEWKSFLDQLVELMKTDVDPHNDYIQALIKDFCSNASYWEKKLDDWSSNEKEYFSDTIQRCGFTELEGKFPGKRLSSISLSPNSSISTRAPSSSCKQLNNSSSLESEKVRRNQKTRKGKPITHFFRIQVDRAGLKESQLRGLYDGIQGLENVSKGKNSRLFFINFSNQQACQKAYAITSPSSIHGFEINASKPVENKTEFECPDRTILQYCKEKQLQIQREFGVNLQFSGNKVIITGPKKEKVKKEFGSLDSIQIYEVDDESDIRGYLTGKYDLCLLILTNAKHYIVGDANSLDIIKNTSQDRFALEKITFPEMDDSIEDKLKSKIEKWSLSLDCKNKTIYLRDLRKQKEIKDLVSQLKTKQRKKRNIKLSKKNFGNEKIQWIKKYYKSLLPKSVKIRKDKIEFQGDMKQAMQKKHAFAKVFNNLVVNEIECPDFVIQKEHLEKVANQLNVWVKISNQKSEKRTLLLIGQKGSGFDQMKEYSEELSKSKSRSARLTASQIKKVDRNQKEMEEKLNVTLVINSAKNELKVIGVPENIDTAIEDIKEETKGKQWQSAEIKIPPVFSSLSRNLQNELRNKFHVRLFKPKTWHTIGINGPKEEIKNCEKFIESWFQRHSFTIKHLKIHRFLSQEHIEEVQKGLDRKQAKIFPPIDLQAYYRISNKVNLHVVDSDIMNVPAQAIVNPANTIVSNAGGLAKIISEWAGPEFQNQCDQEAVLPIGMSNVMNGYQSTFDYIINAVTPVSGPNGSSKRVMENLIEDIIIKANLNEINSITIPLLGYGIHNWSPEDDAEIMAKVLLESHNLREGTLQEIYISAPKVATKVSEVFSDKFKPQTKTATSSFSPPSKQIIKRQWFWCENDGEFIPYGVHQNIQIDKAYQQGKRHVDVVGDYMGTKNGWSYRVFLDRKNDDLPRLQQQNTYTKTLRDIQYKKLGKWIKVSDQNRRHIYINVNNLTVRHSSPPGWNSDDDLANCATTNDFEGFVQTRAGTKIFLENGRPMHEKPTEEKSTTSTSVRIHSLSRRRLILLKVCLWNENLQSKVNGIIRKVERDYIQKHSEEISTSCQLKDELENVYWSRNGNQINIEGTEDAVRKAKRALEMLKQNLIEFPRFWDDSATDLYIPVDVKSREGKEVKKQFLKTCPHYFIKRIVRVQNNVLWEHFWSEKRKLEKKNQKEVIPQRLFHGCGQVTPETICENVETSFDMRYSGEGLWGRACYFAKDASYSVPSYCNETIIDGEECHQIFLAKVLLGECIECRQEKYTTPPERTRDSAGRVIPYDSISGVTCGHKVFMVYANNRAYPEYIISFKKKNRYASLTYQTNSTPIQSHQNTYYPSTQNSAPIQSQPKVNQQKSSILSCRQQ